MEKPENNFATDTDLVQTRFMDDIGMITMNHPRKHNCFSTELVAGILKAFEDMEKDHIRVVVLRAYPGAKIWSAGHNIKEIPLDGQDPLSWNIPFERLLRRVRNCPVPIIGMIEGSVWGGACDLAMTCDLLVGTPTAAFAITPARLGLSYNTAGLTHFLGVLPLHIIKEMLFTAQPISAEDARNYGLLNRLVEPDRLEEITLSLARDIASRAPLAIRVLKDEMRRLTAGLSLTADDFEEIQNVRRQTFRSEDFREGMTAFFEKRPPQFKGK
ncbi:MAG: methylmalonyl-CoA decarboxylase [Deltaproteobacteria bacterium]|nr:methylmalonyl-CoA decarboxylase [Deltaproteobacteria bacterium]